MKKSLNENNGINLKPKPEVSLCQVCILFIVSDKCFLYYPLSIFSILLICIHSHAHTHTMLWAKIVLAFILQAVILYFLSSLSLCLADEASTFSNFNQRRPTESLNVFQVQLQYQPSVAILKCNFVFTFLPPASLLSNILDNYQPY